MIKTQSSDLFQVIFSLELPYSQQIY